MKFRRGKLVVKTSGSWAYIYDWGPQTKNPIPNVTQVVRTWEIPGEQGGQYVLVDLNGPWLVKAKSPDGALAKNVMLELGSVKADVAYFRLPPEESTDNRPRIPGSGDIGGR